MDIQLPKALDRLRLWESADTELNVVLLGYESVFVTKIVGHVFVHEHGFMFTAENGCELTVLLHPAMMFSYDGKILEIKALGWRCRIFENKERRKKS